MSVPQGPPREEQLRALAEKWRREAKDDARYGVKHAIGGPVKEYIGPVNAALAKADCADELESSLLAAAPSSAEEKLRGHEITPMEGFDVDGDALVAERYAQPSADVIARIVQEMRACANSYEGQAEGRSADDFEFLMDLTALVRRWADALASSGAPPHDQKAERVFQAVVYAYEGKDIPDDLRDHGMVRRALKFRAASGAPPPVAPIPLSSEQDKAVKEWAADDRLWTTQETVEFNLRTFARLILKLASGAPQRTAIESYRVEPDKDDGEWHILTFTDGKQVQIFTDRPLVIVEPEQH